MESQETEGIRNDWVTIVWNLPNISYSGEYLEQTREADFGVAPPRRVVVP